MRTIIDLNGRVFEVCPKYDLDINYPELEVKHSSYNQDRLTGDILNIIETKANSFWSVKYSPISRLYVINELKFKKYEEKFDIKFEWKYKKELKAFYNKTYTKA